MDPKFLRNQVSADLILHAATSGEHTGHRLAGWSAPVSLLMRPCRCSLRKRVRRSAPHGPIEHRCTFNCVSSQRSPLDGWLCIREERLPPTGSPYNCPGERTKGAPHEEPLVKRAVEIRSSTHMPS